MLHLEQLWAAVAKKDNQKIIKLINEPSESDLINAVDEFGDSLLLAIIHTQKYKEAPIELLEAIIKHPNCNLAYESPNTKGYGTIHQLLSVCRKDILDIFINDKNTDSRILFDGGKLSYCTVKKSLETKTNSYKSASSKDANSALSKHLQCCIEDLKLMLPVIRDATIRFAISKDDNSIFEQLKQAGDQPSYALATGDYPIDLLTGNNPNLKQWFKTQNDILNQRMALQTNTIFNSMNNLKIAEENRKENRVNYLSKQTELLQQGIKDGADALERLVFQ